VRGATETMRPTVSHDCEDDAVGGIGIAAAAAAGGDDNGGNPLGFNMALSSFSLLLPSPLPNLPIGIHPLRPLPPPPTHHADLLGKGMMMMI
jgi:hypothetical protein